jgi:hypothetical protein
MDKQRTSALGPYNSQGNVWVELTRSEHQHGGDGWGFGVCLWSPSVDKAGHELSIITMNLVSETVGRNHDLTTILTTTRTHTGLRQRIQEPRKAANLAAF